MSAHTPGPWRATYNDVYWEIRSHDAWLGDTCASYCIRDQSGGRIEGGNPVAEHNAKLMAAAPDMFDALNEIKDMWHAFRNADSSDADQDISDSLTRAIDLANVAIAKAKGETA